MRIGVKQMQELQYKGYRIIQYEETTSFLLRNKVQIRNGEEVSPLYPAPAYRLSEDELIEYAERYFSEK